MEQDLISIVVPVYRAENYIEETLDCVRAQTYTNWELLLIEDCGQQTDYRRIYPADRRPADPAADPSHESGSRQGAEPGSE